MKKIRLLFITLISLFLLPSMVSAASGTIKVTSTSTVVVGNKVTVTVTLNSGTSIGSWQMQLNYDKNYLQLTNSTAEAGGTVMSNSSSGTKAKKYTFTFKTLKTGSTKVSIGSYLVYAYADMSELNISTSNKTIKIITQAELEASYSKDNNLKSLEVEGYELSQEFSKDILDYSVTVPEGTKEVKVTAKENDSKASVSGDGIISVSEGINKIPITVRAENGSEKVYNLIVNVIDQNPINVEIDGIKYSVVKLKENYICPDLFTDSTININGIDVPSCINENINYTLVGLKNENNEIYNFIYNNNNYVKYNELVGTSIKLINEKYDGKVDGLIESKEKIDGIEYQVFKFSDNSRFLVVYGINIETGDKDFYIYDTKNKTFSGYDTEYIDYLKEQNKVYLYVIIAFGVGLFLSLICIITLSRKKKKINKEKVKENKQEEQINKVNEKEDNSNLNEIIEENKEEYNLFENDKKKKKKKHNKEESK